MAEDERWPGGPQASLLFELTPNAVYLIDGTTFQFLDANPAGLALLGYPLGELRRLTPLDVSFEWQSGGRLASEQFPRAAQRALEGATTHCEWFLRTATGERIIALVRMRAVPGTNQLVSVVVDVTALRRLEAQLAETQELYRALFEGAPDAILLMKGERFVECNQAALLMFRCDREDVLGRAPWELSPPEQPGGEPSTEAALAKIAGALTGQPQRFEWVHVRKDGAAFPAEVHLNRVVLGGEPHIQAIVRDISERKQAERYQRLLYEFERLVRQISAALLASPAEDIETTVQGAVEQLGRFTSVDRCYVYQFDDQPRAIRCLAEWNAPGIEAAPRLRDLVVEQFGWWLGRLERGEIVAIKSLAEIPDAEQDFKNLLASRGVKSMVHVPLRFRGTVRGFLGCANVQQERQWSPDELALLQVVAELVAAALARRDYELAREKALREAEAASRAKSQFLANVSHELRTPLNGILGAARLLVESPLPAEARDLAEMIHSSARSLLDIVNDILDLGRIEHGLLHLEAVPFNLRSTLEDLLELLVPITQDKELNLTLWYSAEAPQWLVGDPGRVRQVLLNLIGNAVKFTERGEVLVEVERKQLVGDRVTLRILVHDTGLGIPPDKIPTLFDPFARVETPLTRKVEGSGLGLAIVKRLVELMGGVIDVASQARAPRSP